MAIADYHRNDPSLQDKPILLEKVFDIPRRPKAPEPPSEQVNGTAPETATGKRKRDAEEAGLVNGESRAKRVAGAPVTEGDGSHPIVLDEAEEGAILLDD